MKYLLTLSMLGFALAGRGASEAAWRPDRPADWRPDGEAGIYCWWDLWYQLDPGRYRVYAEMRADRPGNFDLQVGRLSDGERMGSLSARIDSGPFREYPLGEFSYDGTWPLRFSDWSAAQFNLSGIRLEQIAALPAAAGPGQSLDTLEQCHVMKRTRLSMADTAKIGSGAALVEVDAREGAPWEHGVTLPLVLDRCNTLSFWIFWESEPAELYLQLFTASGQYGVAFIAPGRYDAVQGEWVLLELPVKAFTVTPAADLEELDQVRGLLIGCPASDAPVRFRVDDVLAELL